MHYVCVYVCVARKLCKVSIDRWHTASCEAASWKVSTITYTCTSFGLRIEGLPAERTNTPTTQTTTTITCVRFAAALLLVAIRQQTDTRHVRWTCKDTNTKTHMRSSSFIYWRVCVCWCNFFYKVSDLQTTHRHTHTHSLNI